jgi:hypothetical protein
LFQLAAAVTTRVSCKEGVVDDFADRAVGFGATTTTPLTVLVAALIHAALDNVEVVVVVDWTDDDEDSNADNRYRMLLAAC